MSRGVPELLEKQVVALGDKLMDALGFTSVHFSQARASKQTPGIPDRKYYHAAKGLSCWWEAKRDGGKQSDAQRDFEQMAVACGEFYVLGTDDDLLAWCRARRLCQ